MGVHFLRPETLLWLGAALPAILVLWLINYWGRTRARKAFADGKSDKVLSRHTPTASLLSELFGTVVWLAIEALLIFAAAQPTMPAAPEKAAAGTMQVVFLTDVSRSMGAEDYRDMMPDEDGSPGSTVQGPHGSRLQVAQRVMERKLMPALKGNPKALINYSGEGWPLTPTFVEDQAALKWIIKHRLKIGQAKGNGSDMSYGLQEAIDMFEEFGEAGKDKVIVMFTDGGFTGEQEKPPPQGNGKTKEQRLDDAVQTLSKKGIRLIIVAVGLEKPVQIPVYGKGADGRQHPIGVIRKKTEEQGGSGGSDDGSAANKGDPVTCAYEPNVVKSLVQKSGAEFFHVRDPNNLSDLDIKFINALAGSKVENRAVHAFQYPLGAAGLLLFSMFGARAFVHWRKKRAARQS